MKSNAQQVGQKLKSNKYKCPTCGEWKVFVPFDDKGKMQSCADCMAAHPGVIQKIKNVTREQWTWLIVQAVGTLYWVYALGWVSAIIANLGVVFIINAAREVWPEKK